MSHQTVHTVSTKQKDQVEKLTRRRYRLRLAKSKKGPEQIFHQDSITLGSREGNDFVIDDPTVSRLHARIDLDDRGFRLTDLGSTNGTFLANRRVQVAYVEAGDRIGVGDVDVVLELAADEVDLELAKDSSFGSLRGSSAAMRRVFEQLERLAAADTTLLLLGETGSGKDVAANEVHLHSKRAQGPFVVVDCGSLPETLIEAELFGHEKGAFTGADQKRIGAFEQANRGTLFLDEVGELPLPAQRRLLRVIESRTVRPVGSNETRPIDVRLIGATHRDLLAACNEGTFREDLYFRLAVAPVRIPPLRERLEDLPVLISAILEQLGSPEGMVLDERTLSLLHRRHWGGNVRELKNAVQRALIFGSEAFALDTDQSDAPLPKTELSYREAKALALQEFERQFITELLTRWKGNVTKAAAAAGVDPAWIFRLAKRNGIVTDSFRR